MGGKTWSLKEEKYFWRTVVPNSPRRVGADRAKHEVSWSELAAWMKRYMGGDARREYNATLLFEHFFQNVESKRQSPNSGRYLHEYLVKAGIKCLGVSPGTSASNSANTSPHTTSVSAPLTTAPDSIASETTANEYPSSGTAPPTLTPAEREKLEGTVREVPAARSMITGSSSSAMPVTEFLPIWQEYEARRIDREAAEARECAADGPINTTYSIRRFQGSSAGLPSPELRTNESAAERAENERVERLRFNLFTGSPGPKASASHPASLRRSAAARALSTRPVRQYPLPMATSYSSRTARHPTGTTLADSPVGRPSIAYLENHNDENHDDDEAEVPREFVMGLDAVDLDMADMDSNVDGEETFMGEESVSVPYMKSERTAPNVVDERTFHMDSDAEGFSDIESDDNLEGKPLAKMMETK